MPLKMLIVSESCQNYIRKGWRKSLAAEGCYIERSVLEASGSESVDM
jgi:hypothetical protein